ncbi:hypothetical protein M0802_012735 [Mischocyttarus mexicanus]|nr:hypothetical protein M0802_012735 [Mischocyttarus mexicanus]
MESGEDVAYFYTEPVEEENPPSTPENSVEQDQLEERVGVSSTTEDSDECNFLNLLVAIADDLSRPYEYQEEDSGMVAVVVVVVVVVVVANFFVVSFPDDKQ